MKSIKAKLIVLLLLHLIMINVYGQVPVLNNPANQTVLEGETATFSVSVVGGLLPVTYQWQATFDQNISNFANIPGGTSASYTTPPTDLGMNNGWYRCVVTNDSGGTISNYGILTVNPIIAPSIVTQPVSQSIFIGETATFSVTASGTDPLTYQWYANSIAIPGATSSSFTTDPINDIAFNGTIIYCIVTNGGGSTESNSATLNVSYENVRITDGLQVLYNFKEGTGNTVNDESGVGTPLNLVIDNVNNVNWTAQGLNVGTEVRIKSTSIASKIIGSCVASNEMTFEAWFIPTDMIQREIYARIMTMTNTSKNTSNIKLDQFGTDYGFHVRTTNTGLNGETYTSSDHEQELVHYVATKDASGNFSVYLNGTEVINETVTGNFSNWDNGYFLYLGSDAENNTYWKGTFYLTAIYSKALNETEITQNYLFGVEHDDFPIFVKQPTDLFLVPAGQTATFEVEAVGPAPLSYQWHKNNNPISGANEAIYTTPQLNLGNNNDTYKCVVTSGGVSSESNSATLTVAEPSDRITLDIIAQYTFQEGSGTVINDVSGVGDPLNLIISTPESVNWLEDGIEIVSAADIATSAAASKIYNLCTATNELTIETWITPLNNTQNGPSRIVSYSEGVSARNFSLSQEAAEYSTRLRTSNTTENGFPLVVTDNLSVETEPQHIVYVFRGDAVGIIFVNGVEVVRRTLGGDFSTWSNSYRFSIVNEFVDSRPWLGSMNYLGIFNRRLTAEEVLHNYNVGPFNVDSTLNAPTELLAVSTEYDKVNLSWTDNSTNEDYFIIERSESNPVIWTQVAKLPTNTVVYSDTNVTEGTEFTYRVKAFNVFLNIENAVSNSVVVTTSLKKPTGLVGKADELGKITLNWTDNSSAETGFNIERGNGDADSVIYTVVGTVDTNVTAFEDFGIEEGILYSYKIKAFNSLVSSDESNVLSIRSKASFVSAPSDLNIELHPIYGLPVLTWVDNAFNESGFVIERRKVAIGMEFTAIDTLAQDSVTFTDVTATDSTSYIYRVFAFNDEFNSDYSAEVFIDVLVGINTNEEIPNEFSLLQNYPNPFNPSTTFTFNLPEVSDVNLTVYNLLGQKIINLVENNYAAGRHSINFDASNLTSGIYVYSIKVSSNSGKKFIDSKKFILLK